MRDDFSALDLLSAGGFHWSSDGKKLPKKKKLFAFPRRKPRAQAKRLPLTEFLPMLAAKVKQPGAKRLLRGWPVTLSWPGSDSGEHGPH
jgi:hypothetical protein